MPAVLFTYEDEKTVILTMTFIEGQNVLNPAFSLKSKTQKQKFADDVISGILGWHSITNGKFRSIENPAYNSWYEYYKKRKAYNFSLKQLKFSTIRPKKTTIPCLYTQTLI